MNVWKRTRRLCVPGLLIGVNVPDNVIRQAIDAVAGALGHFGKALCFSLIFKGVAGEVDAWWWDKSVILQEKECPVDKLSGAYQICGHRP